MVINIWQYADLQTGIAAPSLKQQLAYSTALSRARYIFDMQLSDRDVQVMLRVKPVGDYIHKDGHRAERITGRYAYNLPSDEPEGWSEDMAIQGAAGGLDRFWHIVVSSREGEDLTEEQLAHVRKVVLDVLGIARCPSIWATHGDTKTQHSHGLVSSFLAQSDERVTFGQGWWKEAGQIAMAIIERDLGLDPEPNRRFVADRTGVYSTFTDMKVADEHGRIIDRAAITAMHKAHDKWRAQNYASEGQEPGGEWDLARAVKQIAAQRIQLADTPEEIHESLARVGLRYVASATGAWLVANDFRPGSGKNAGGQSIAAGKAYANAALGKLNDRFKKVGGYRPAAPSLYVRPFVMPRFNKLDGESARTYAEHQAEIEEADALLQHLNIDNGESYRRRRDKLKGAGANAAHQARKLDHQDEIAAALTLRDELNVKSSDIKGGTQQAPGDADHQTVALIWGPPPGKPNAKKQERSEADRRDIEARYHIERSNREARYWLDGHLAFIERRRTIELVTRKRRALIDALKIARDKFRAIRVAARHRIRASMARIASELRLRIHAGWLNKIGRQHRELLAEGKAESIVDRSMRYHATAPDRINARGRARSQRLHAQQGLETPNGPTEGLGADGLVARYLSADDRRTMAGNAERDRATRDALEIIITEIDHDSLALASSRQTYSALNSPIRYLDDARLIQSMGGSPELLVDADIQRALRASELLQLEKRRWVAGAIASGHATLEEGRVSVSGHPGHWAERYWEAQRHDPSFLRLVHVARARPEGFPFDHDATPETRAMEAAKRDGDWKLQWFLAGVVQRTSPFALIAKARREAAGVNTRAVSNASSQAAPERESTRPSEIEVPTRAPDPTMPSHRDRPNQAPSHDIGSPQR